MAAQHVRGRAARIEKQTTGYAVMLQPATDANGREVDPVTRHAISDFELAMAVVRDWLLEADTAPARAVAPRVGEVSHEHEDLGGEA